MRYSRLLIILVLLGFGVNNFAYLPGASPQRGRKNEGDQAKHYKKWLNEDVDYIISQEERDIFKKLQNDEERDAFIEQFWSRRNPDPRSSNNPFKEEHYRRIAYTNERFTSGIPGWKTDRGRIYIMYGPPDELESHPTGGQYYRPYWEGGGSTTTYPFEKWWYRHIDGIGDDIEIEFVDQSNTGEYRMAMSPDEKDALIHVPNAGLTLAEEMGLADKRDREYFNPSSWNDSGNAQNMGRRAKDSPFNRMEQFFNLQRPPQIKFDDLKAMVTTKVTFSNLPYDVRVDFLKLSSEKILVPITIELSNRELEFKKEMDFNRATVNIYGLVTSLTGRIAAEWDDTISTEFIDQYFDLGKNKRSAYQRIIALAPGMRYKLDLVLKDVNSKNVGAQSIGLNVPKFADEALQSSTIILANSIASASRNSDQLEQYVIGDMKVVPNVKAEYLPGQNLITYVQIYNMQIDQNSQKPSLHVTFVIKNNNKVVEELKNTAVNSEQFFYGQRVVLLGKVPLEDVAPGKYTLEIKVVDNIANRTIFTSTDFKVNAPIQAVSSLNP